MELFDLGAEAGDQDNEEFEDTLDDVLARQDGKLTQIK